MQVGGRFHLGEYWNLTPSLPLATPETIEYTLVGAMLLACGNRDWGISDSIKNRKKRISSSFLLIYARQF